MSDDVTVVIPTRNRFGMLRRALRSACDQVGVSLQVVVVDEGSTDATPRELSRWSDSRLAVVRHDEPRGVATARNAGLARADGHWVAFLDDDDVWAPGKLRAQMDAITDAGGGGWGSTSAVWLHHGLRLGRPERAFGSGDVADLVLARNIVPGGASNVLAETALVRSVGGFDTAFATLADWDLWIRLGQAAPYVTVDRPLHGYYVHAGSMAHDVRRTERELRLIDEKYAGLRHDRRVALEEAQILQYLGAWALRQGDRRAAARLYWKLATSGDDRRMLSAAACVVGSVWPGVQHVRDRRAVRRLPPGWREAVEAWLQPLRHLDGRPPTPDENRLPPTA